MKISLNWLKELAPSLALSETDIIEKLTTLGIEVEAVERIGGAFTKVVVGKVLEKEKHANADKLSVCKVDVGAGDALQIVCGASNVAAGQTVPVALVGATLVVKKDGVPTTLEIKKSKIRGVDSQGMICAEDELGLSDDHSGIMVLSDDYAVGTPFENYVERDTILEISITPNRPDVLSHLGVARELVGVSGVKALAYDALPFSRSQSRIRIDDADNCPHYAAVVIEGVTIAPSPKWLQTRLKAIGLRPINNVADVTNYVLHSVGQPLHAFDLDMLMGKKIVVRSNVNEPFKTLDGKMRQIEQGMVMICDAEKPVAIGGVMGGLESEISDKTKNVLLEAAYFAPSSIRRTAKKLALSTEAAYRYERGIDWGNLRAAAAMATKLILDLAGGTVVETSEVVQKEREKVHVEFRPARATALLGVHIETPKMVEILTRLGFEKKNQSAEKIGFAVPTFRVDIEQEEDLIEEIARVYGYDHIPASEKMNASYPQSRDKKQGFDDLVREMMIGFGFKEILTNPLLKYEDVAPFSTNIVRTLNSVSEDMEAMRPALAPSMLKIIAHNINRGNADLRLFEVAHVFETDPTCGEEKSTLVRGYVEKEMLGLAVTGRREPRRWAQSHEMSDFYDVKGAVEALLQRLHLLEKTKFIPYTPNALRVEFFDAERNAAATGQVAGMIYAATRETLTRYDIRQPVFWAELDMSILKVWSRFERVFKEPAIYPAVWRDLAFFVPTSVHSRDLIEAMRTIDSLIETVEVFDVYDGKETGSATPKRSVAFSLKLVSYERTLTEQDISSLLANVIKAVESNFGAELRQA